jgi:hypothetical protein
MENLILKVRSHGIRFAPRILGTWILYSWVQAEKTIGLFKLERLLAGMAGEMSHQLSMFE